MKHVTIFLLVLGLVLFLSSSAGAKTIYVKSGANGGGTSWSGAFSLLQDALDAADPHDEIWVAAGTYKPTSDYGLGIGDRGKHFRMKNNVGIYGGFPATGEPGWDDREPEMYETILSGDLLGNDTGDMDDPSRNDNSYHVTIGSGTNATACLDGFTITGGHYYVTCLIPPCGGGGGMFNDNGSPMLIDCTFTKNVGNDGGGICNYNDSCPTLINCTFTWNWALSGGGVYNYNSSPTLTNCTFIGNSAIDDGGGIYNHAYYGECKTAVANCMFHHNACGGWGGGMFNYGDLGGQCEPRVTNCTFSDNAAEDGGGILNLGLCVIPSPGHCGPILTNCIFWANTGGEVMNLDCALPTLSYCDIEGGYTGVGNIGPGNMDTDPLFIDPDGPDGIAGTQDDDLRLSANSPCIDAGDNSAVTVTTDLAGNARIVDTVDMGAYEFQGTHLVYVDADASGANNGQSWADAYTSLAVALMDATYPDEIRVAQGTYRPNDGVVEIGDERDLTFQLKNGVTVKGGYAGYGEPDPNVRDIDAYETILSGDLYGNDGPDFANNGDNSYHVVTGSGTDATAVLDGFTITAGNDDEVDPDMGGPWGNGGGMYNRNGSPTLTNCTFSENSVNGIGGGMHNHNSGPTLINCTFSGNATDYYGGGMANSTGPGNTSGSPTLTNCTFSGNSAGDGGGMYNKYSSPTLVNCEFVGNLAKYNDGTSRGGGIYNFRDLQTLTNCIFRGNSADYGGGMYNTRNSPTLINCTFGGNSAEDNGGAMYNQFNNPVLMNCLFKGNLANSGGGMYNWESSPTLTSSTFAGNSGANGSALACDSSRQMYPGNLELTNCILWDGGDEVWNNDGSTITIRYSDIQGGETGVYDPYQGLVWILGNIDADPLFVNADGADDTPGTEDDDLRLSADSPCIDAGDNSAVTATTDLDGNSRIVNGIVDMGAYEFPGIVYVDDDAPNDPQPGDFSISDPLECGYPEHPFDGIQEAIDCARNGHTVIVLPGNYNEAFNFIGKSITVTSDGEEPAVLEAPGNYVATFQSGEDPNSVLKNFIIRNSNIGVFCNFAAPTLKYLTVVENVSGIEAWNGSSPQISNSIFWDNDNSDLLLCRAVYSCIERENQSSGLGNFSLNPLFADPGGNGDYHLKSQGWRWRDLIAHGSHWTWDGVTSPCIDTGNPGSPLGAEPVSIPEDPNNEWGLNLRANMGAYGETSQASMAMPGWCLQSDTDNDGRVDMKELIMLRDQWLIWEIAEPYCDFNRDGIVNLGDYQILAKEWLKEALTIQ